VIRAVVDTYSYRPLSHHSPHLKSRMNSQKTALTQPALRQSPARRMLDLPPCRIFMIIFMRTTVQLDDDLFRRAKAAAAAAGITLSRLIEDSLRENLRRVPTPERTRARGASGW